MHKRHNFNKNKMNFYKNLKTQKKIKKFKKKKKKKKKIGRG